MNKVLHFTLPSETAINKNIKRILLVEDNPDELELIQLAFNELGIPHEVYVIEDGQQAVDYLFGAGEFGGPKQPYNPDIAFLDLKLPKLSGFEVLKMMRENPHTMHVPVVIFTSSSMQVDILAAYELGVNSLITKPINANEFMACVKAAGTYWLQWNHPPPDN